MTAIELQNEPRTPVSESLCEIYRKEIERILSKADERELRIVYQFITPLDR